ncbi:MAG: hypothetical protein HYX25_02695 [Candidatus Solibacter usitatus]|nr:hypothetical protein [Candidatus Solibacter usitatus]
MPDYRRLKSQERFAIGNDRFDLPPILTDKKLMPARRRGAALFVVATGGRNVARARHQGARRKALCAQDQRSDHQNGYPAH